MARAIHGRKSEMILRQQRWSKDRPCPICGGYPSLPQGKGERCYGYLSSDGKYAHCTREEYANGIPQNPSSNTYPHNLAVLEITNQIAPEPTQISGKRQIEAIYPYRDEKGNILYETVRYYPKGFCQRRRTDDTGWIYNLEGTRKVPYRLPDLLASSPEQPIYIVEGEKDVDALRKLGFVATCNPMGALKWHLLDKNTLKHFSDRHVVLIPDNDEIGLIHVEQVALALNEIAQSIRILQLPHLRPKGDVSDWIATQEEPREALDELAQKTSPYDPNRKLPEETSYCPPLPDEIETDGLRTDTWIDLYADYGHALSPMTPRSFHISAALWLISSAIARRLVLRMPFGNVYPNLWIAWIAPTTLHGKTTALEIVKGISKRCFAHLLAPQDATPEALIFDMSGQEPANLNQMSQTEKDRWTDGRHYAGQRGLVLDELSGLLAQASKDYNLGLVESMLRLYDCEEEFCRSTIKRGWQTVKNAYLSIITASTPEAVASAMLRQSLWSNGWWPRFALLSAKNKAEWHAPEEKEEPEAISEAIRSLLAWLPSATWPHPSTAVSVSLSDGVYESWSIYSKTLRYDMLNDDLEPNLWGTYGRLPVHVLKIAICLAALDRHRTGSVQIEPNHLKRAVLVAEEWRNSAHYLVDSIGAVNQNDVFRRASTRILQFLQSKEPQASSIRDICKSMRRAFTPDEITDTVRQLEISGAIERIQIQSGSRGGRPTTRYRISSSLIPPE